MNALSEEKPAAASPVRHADGGDGGGPATTTPPPSRLKKALDAFKKAAGVSPSVATPARKSSARAKKGKASLQSPPEAKAPEEKKKRGRPAKTPPTEEEKGKGKAKAKASTAPAKKRQKAATLPGWNIEGELLWKAYGDLSLMPKTDSIVAVSLNDGVIQAGDAWRRRQGYFSKDAEDWIWWSAACVPALRAIASGSAGASAFSPDGGAGLAGFLPKKPINLVATFHGGPDAAVSAAESSAEAALSRVAPAPAHPLFLLRSDGVIKGAVDGKMAQKLETIYDAAASRILDEEGSSPPFVVCIMRSKNKEGMLEQIAELVAPKLGLPAPDASKSTWVAGAVGKNWFEGDGGGGSSFVEPSDADAQFALQAGFGNVLEMPEAFGPSELKKSVEGHHGFLSGALEHYRDAVKAAAAAAGPAEGAAVAAGLPADGRELIAAFEKALDPEIRNNRGLIAMFKAVQHYWGELQGSRVRAATFRKVANRLQDMDDELGVLDTPEKFKPLCVGPEKLEGFAQGTFKRAKQWMETGLPEELEKFKK